MKQAQRLLPRRSGSATIPSPLTPHHTTTAAASRSAPRRTLYLLQHHHLKPASPDSPPFIRYADADALQEEHRARFLAYKTSPATAAPPPQLLTFQAQPTYTLGRRQDALSPAQAARLTQPLTIPSQPVAHYTPQVHKTNRGGLTTYHGPGQLVLWPVLDMHSPRHARFGVASYAALLEATTRALLADLWGIATYANPQEPGVWVARAGHEERKIAALGVHHRRYVTALGVALNVDVPTAGADESVNPWARFVPCGLAGKMVTSVAAETGSAEQAARWDMERLAEEWAARFEEGLLKGSV
ncbi:Lipoyltransferase, putative [Cordyceps militaris]|uniref:lipoyl(octanoyl) transferase n=1 Tax=Cordyceps militaris TaxID=73501 RepID=A0A2H4SAR6_CORMI|nr:Lipoyltransferase, putative [Cordyceps militaris]